MFSAPAAGIHLLLPGSCDSLATWIEQVCGTIFLHPSRSQIFAPVKAGDKSGCVPA